MGRTDHSDGSVAGVRGGAHCDERTGRVMVGARPYGVNA